MQSSNESRWNIRIQAFFLLARAHKREVRGMLRDGYRYLGVHGGDHVIRDPQGRQFGVDLVVGSVRMFVGVPPKATPW
jgi:hypothetical protein